ncbi:MAG: hypothetical protein KDK24_07545 [Pseudooceanicola sp.]|nr:hypothetical protein [Pseudooceanicola sp.]
MTIACRRKPWIMAAIHDAVVALDVQSAFAEAGFDYVSYDPDLVSAPSEGALDDCSLVLLDQDFGWAQLKPLAEKARADRVPALILMYDENDRSIPAELSRAARLAKPFDTEKLVESMRRVSQAAP